MCCMRNKLELDYALIKYNVKLLSYKYIFFGEKVRR